MNVTLRCVGIGGGSITYQWEISNNNEKEWMNITNANNKRFVVMNLKQSQQYRCVVFNEAGSTKSKVASITALLRKVELVYSLIMLQ